MFRILNHGPKFDECQHHCPWSPNGKLSRVDKCTLSINGSIANSFKIFRRSDLLQSSGYFFITSRRLLYLENVGKLALHKIAISFPGSDAAA